MNDLKFEEMIKIMEYFKTYGIRGTGKNLQTVLDFQDIIGRSTNNDIIAAWERLNENQRKIFIWSVTCCISYDATINIIDLTLGREAKKKMAKQFDNEFQQLEKTEIDLNNRFHQLEKKEKEIKAIVEAQEKIQIILNGIKN